MNAAPAEPADRPRTILAIVAAAALAGLAAMASDWLTPLDKHLLDAQTRVLQYAADTDAALVEIDAASLKELGSWPWPRTRHAHVIDTLARAGAARIVIDIDFSADSTPQADAALVEAVRNADGRVFLPVFWQPTSVTARSQMLFEPFPALREHARLGSVNLAPARDGPVRQLADLTPDGTSESTPALANVLNPDRRGVARLIDYRISPESFPTLSFATLLNDPASAQALRGRTVFLGATAMELGDLVAVPVHGSLPGVLVQMLSYETVRSSALRAVSPAIAGFVVVLIAIAAAWFGHRLRWSMLTLFALGGCTVMLAMSAVLHATLDLWWMPMPGVVACLAACTATLISRLHGESLRAVHYWVHYRRQNALLREVVTQSTEAILTLDDQGRILTANPTAVKLFGSREHALAGQPLRQHVPDLDDALLTGAASALPREVPLRRAGHEPLVLEVSAAGIHVEGEHIVSVRMRDITMQKNRERELRYHATHDALTRLPNRLALSERLAAAFPEEGPKKRGALLLMDLDGFKEVNDSLGHSIGDLVLKEIAGRFASLLPAGAFVARLGGDEFALVLQRSDAVDDSELQWVCRAFLASASEPVPVRGVPVSLGVSGGLALWPEHATDGEALLQKADFALYAAKNRRTVLETYDPSGEPNSPRRLEMLTLLRTAVRQEELYLVYQPKVHLATGATRGVEALSRWRSPELGEVSPGEFIPLAEATEIITPLTRWTLETGLRDCAAWRAHGWPIDVAINLSARHLQSSQLVDDVAELLEAVGLPPRALELEITESALMSDPQRAFAILTQLRKLGVALSIDDFGTGYSSLGYLQRLQVDRLKIDRSFVENLPFDKGSRAIVSSTIQLAHALDLQVVAEGIENQAQHDILGELGCDYGQGYFYARGMRHEDVTRWLVQREPVPARRLA